MTEKRYKRLVSSIDYYYCIDTNDDKGLTEDDMLNRLNEQDKLIRELRAEVEVHKYPLFSTRQAEEKIERYESDLRMCREKALYWRNKAEDIFGDMRTNVELKRENEQLKSTNMEMEDYIGRLEEEKIKLEICLRRDNEQLKKEIKYLQSELHNATFNIRDKTLNEVKLEIEKLERWE